MRKITKNQRKITYAILIFIFGLLALAACQKVIKYYKEKTYAEVVSEVWELQAKTQAISLELKKIEERNERKQKH